MPARELQEQLNTLREQLEQNPPLTEPERDNLHELMGQIESQIALENATHNSSLADEVNLAVERFDVAHPKITATLRSIADTLVSIGV